MRLSRKADYGLRALLTLTTHHGEGPIPARLIAKENDVPRAFLESILLEMKARGWVGSVPGRTGGYFLSVPPNQITMGQIVRFFDGVLAPIGCISTKQFEDCSQAGRCRFRRILLEIRNHVDQLMDAETLLDLTNRDHVHRDEVFQIEIPYGDGI
ncbi:MAG: Rrf2 family transcriptional regulator [Planctomycetes bacterium]|nr:Rrf2 family transcriptional regulator [Planctomycetota bacterium]